MDRNSKRSLPKWILEKSGNASSRPKLDYNGSIIFANTLPDCGLACEEILESNSHLDEIILGFDMEWPVTYKSGESSSCRTSLIQICANANKCYLFHVKNLRRLPLTMIQLMEHPKTKLVGVNIACDLWKLGRDFDVPVKSIIDTKVVDLGKLANVVLKCSQNWSLNGLVIRLLKLELEKNAKVRKSNWSSPDLTEDQRKYAATDAFASYTVYQTLMKLMKGEKEENVSFSKSFGSRSDELQEQSEASGEVS